MTIMPFTSHYRQRGTTQEVTFSVKPWAVRIAKRLINQGAVVGWLTLWAGLGDWLIWPPASIEAYSTMQRVFPGDVSLQPVILMVMGLVFLVCWAVPRRQVVRIATQMAALLWSAFIAISLWLSGVGSGAGLHVGLVFLSLTVLYGMQSRALQRST